jgi:hypothetical protein
MSTTHGGVLERLRTAALKAVVRGAAVICAAVICATASAFADVVELKTGQRVEGTLKQATTSSVAIEVGGQTITFEGDKVRAVYFGAAPAVTSPQPSLRGDALRALKGLQSATAGGVIYRDYASRVTDAKIIVDRYLQDDKSDNDSVKAAIAGAMNYYTIATRAWSASFPGANSEALMPDPAIHECVTAMKEIERRRKDLGQLYKDSPRKDSLDGIYLAAHFSSIWPCASDKIAEAERLAGATK